MAKQVDLEGNVDTETGEMTQEQAVAIVDDKFFAQVGIAIPDTDPAAIQAQIVARVMKAETLDQLFGVWEAKTSDQLENKVVTVRSVEWSGYNAEIGLIPMAKVQAYDEIDKKDIDFISTAPNLTSFIAKAGQMGQIPFTAKIVGVKTRNGQTSLHFEKPQ
jgi:hypothetical protein